MMRVHLRNFLPVILLISFFSASAQDCGCSDNFKFVIERVKNNYAGYSDKINASNKTRFRFFTDSLLKESATARPYQCLPILRQWLSFFQDKHMNISYSEGNATRELVRQYYAKEEKTQWTDSLFSNYLMQNKNTIDGLEGVWKDNTGAYRIGIVRDGNDRNDFVGFILQADGARWIPGQVKLRITKNKDGYSLKYFRAVDHSLNRLSFSKQKDTLTMGDRTVSSKWYKSNVIVPANKESAVAGIPRPRFSILDEKTALIQMPSYAVLSYVSVMDSLLKANAVELDKHEHLIIDLRDNYGGSVLIYDKLIPYIYTGPILTEGAKVLATEENIRDYYSQIPTNVSDSLKNVFTKNLQDIKAHVNQLYTLYPVDTIKMPQVHPYPKKVSLIVNRNTASAAELFILQARQSSKVKLYGSNSSGAIDYLEVVKAKLPCGFYSLGYPAARSLRLPAYPLDNIGIAPDKTIPKGIADWVDYVRESREDR
ncbi:S41 family peptidase [Pedobacter sp. GSP4]|uniref:S41 family peptidase n=1 Tax=Pedobacter sp. GSP4 TaxID=3453716 RepID=UPI003EEA5837